MDEFIDEAFTISYPAWVLVHESGIEHKDGIDVLRGDAKFVFLTGDSGNLSAPVFTDEDLAFRFIEASNLDSTVPVSADDPQQLLNFVEEFKVGDATLIVFDPDRAVGWKRRNWPIDDVIESLKTDQPQ